MLVLFGAIFVWGVVTQRDLSEIWLIINSKCVFVHIIVCPCLSKHMLESAD